MTKSEQPVSLEECMAHLLIWRHAVEMQAIRIFAKDSGMPSGPITNQADCYLFAVALRNVLRATDLIRRNAPQAMWSRLDDAKRAFDAVVPHAVDARYVLEHFDEYAEGDGHLQKGRQVMPQTAWHEEGRDTYSFNIGIAPGVPLLTFEVRSAAGAAVKLAHAVGEVMRP